MSSEDHLLVMVNTNMLKVFERNPSRHPSRTMEINEIWLYLVLVHLVDSYGSEQWGLET